MNNLLIENRIKKIVAKQLNINIEDINLNSSFIDDLGADSLDIVELTIALEEEFKKDMNSEISEADAKNLKTVGDVVKYINKKFLKENSN